MSTHEKQGHNNAPARSSTTKSAGTPSGAGKASRAGKIYRSASGRGAPGLGSAADAAVSSLSGSTGFGLPSTMRPSLENALGTDLSPVRLHTGSTSAGAARSLGANAFAFGQDIHFGAGKYDPGSTSGQHLIAHEVAHTVQQSGAGGYAQASLEVSQPGDAHEVEADRFADSFMSGRAAAVTPVSRGVVARATVQREEAEEDLASATVSWMRAWATLAWLAGDS
ncbi:MAG: DUF4157 domain-containing protein [Myxococcota bacterium]